MKYKKSVNTITTVDYEFKFPTFNIANDFTEQISEFFEEAEVISFTDGTAIISFEENDSETMEIFENWLAAIESTAEFIDIIDLKIDMFIIYKAKFYIVNNEPLLNHNNKIEISLMDPVDGLEKLFTFNSEDKILVWTFGSE